MRDLAITTLLIGLLAAPAAAEDVAAIDARAAIVVARTNLEAAKTAREAARLQALGLTSDATGKTDLKEKGGELEGWMLSARSLDKAAAGIRNRLAGVATPGPIVLLAADEQFDLTLPLTVKARLKAAVDTLAAATAQPACSTPAPAPAGAGVDMQGAALLPYIGALIGAFRTDTEISGVAGPSDERLLVNALARHAAADPRREWIIPADLVAPPASGTIGALWQGVNDARTRARACRIRIGDPPGAAKVAAARLDAAIDAADSLENALEQTGDTRGLLAEAIRLEVLEGRNPLILRVYLERGGGSLIVRKNLWTTLGASAVGVTGGSVASWRLVNPRSGAIVTGGLLFCRTALTSLRAVHDGRVRAAECGETMP
ncbi:MAG: hypothetical protein ABW182_02540 [Sphingomonas sp.]